MDEATILAPGRQLGKCYLPDPDPQASPRTDASYPLTTTASAALTYTYAWIEHDGIGHPGGRIGERFFMPRVTPG